MSSKPNPSASPGIPLPEATVLVLAGPDAMAFAQAQFANDVNALMPGHWHWNAWLNPKGRVIALFRLARPEPETLVAVLEDYPASMLAERLVRFRFRSRVRIDAEAPHVLGHWRESTPESMQTAARRPDGGLDLVLDGHRLLQLLPTGAADAGTDASSDAIGRWRLADVRAGIPHLREEDVESFTAHMLGLDQLGAISLRKGCYPGHEIVARSHYLGQVKRGLHRVRAEAAMPEHGPIRDAGGDVVGHLLGAAPIDANASEGLAVLPSSLDAETTRLRAGTSTLRLV